MAWDWDKLQQQKKAKSGGGGGGDSEGPPNLDEVLGKIKDLKGKIGGSWIIILIILIAVLGYNTIYKIDPDEVGVIQRFGKHIRTTYPGLHFKWPRGIEKLTKVPVMKIQSEKFGHPVETLMLTGDLNVAVVPWIVQYNIKDADQYLFKVRDVNATLRDLSESTVRVVIGDRSINEVINKRDEIARQAMELLQKELDEAETGINVTTIEMQETNVPERVQPSWNEVNQAEQEKAKMIQEAEKRKNTILPQARGQAEKTIKEAEGYYLDRTNRAKGDASRFLALYEEYSKAKDVTRRRLYLEALRDIFPKLGEKYIVDADQKNLLPLLNLGKPTGGQK